MCDHILDLFPWKEKKSSATVQGVTSNRIREGEKGAGAVQSGFGLLAFHHRGRARFGSRFCSRASMWDAF